MTTNEEMAARRSLETNAKAPEKPRGLILWLHENDVIALVVRADAGGGVTALDAEDAWPLSDDFLRGARWIEVPPDYRPAFTNRDDI